MNRTEMRNPRSMHLDQMDTKSMVELISSENRKVNDAIDAASAEIAQVCESAAASVCDGGRVFYVGAGTSGRLGVCDAAECPPTFGVDPALFTGVIAGGHGAMFRSSEGAEDSFEMGKADLEKEGVCEKDLVVGISASGNPSYVLGAIEAGKAAGAVTAAIVNNHGSKMEAAADISVVLDTGEEVVTGSTRMKAGTSQKIVLNMISTIAMVKAGNVYENLMINLQPTNIKLRGRMIRIVSDITGCGPEEAEERLNKADWKIRDAVK